MTAVDTRAVPARLWVVAGPRTCYGCAASYHCQDEHEFEIWTHDVLSD